MEPRQDFRCRPATAASRQARTTILTGLVLSLVLYSPLSSAVEATREHGIFSDPSMVLLDDQGEIAYWQGRGTIAIAAEEVDLRRVEIQEGPETTLVGFQMTRLHETQRFPDACDAYSLYYRANGDRPHYVDAYRCVGWPWLFVVIVYETPSTYRIHYVTGEHHLTNNTIIVHIPTALHPSDAHTHIASALVSTRLMPSQIYYRDAAAFPGTEVRFDPMLGEHSELLTRR